MQLNCDLDSIEEQNEHQEESVKFKALDFGFWIADCGIKREKAKG